MNKNELIAMLPIGLIFLISTIFMWVSNGWKAGLIIPFIVVLSILIIMWMEYWESKDTFHAEEEQ